MKSIRLKEFDYSDENVYYFVTLRFERRLSNGLLGEIYRVFLHLFKETDFMCDALVVLPDHLHFLTHKKKASNKSLSDLICVMKSKGLYLLKSSGKTERSFWQRNYYEHVIRNEADFIEKASYIIGNSIKECFPGTDSDYEYLFVQGIMRGATQGRPLRGGGAASVEDGATQGRPLRVDEAASVVGNGDSRSVGRAALGVVSVVSNGDDSSLHEDYDSLARVAAGLVSADSSISQPEKNDT